MDMKNTEATTDRYYIVKLPGKGEGWAIFDTEINSTIVGSRCKVRREVFEDAAERGITLKDKR